MYRQPVYEKMFGNISLENSEKLAGMVMSLPMHPYLDEETQDYIFNAVKSFYVK